MSKGKHKVLVCGSISYDTIVSVKDLFSDHIHPENLSSISIAFNVAKPRKEYGGCAANIVYNMSLIGCEGAIVASVGNDFDVYSKWLTEIKLCQDYIKVIEDQLTAQDFIINDINNNQIASFYPGAIDYSHFNLIQNLDGVQLGVVSPDGLKGMHLHAKQFAESKIPFLFDPGQVTPLFSSDELFSFIKDASWAIFNLSEWNSFHKKTGLSHDDLSAYLNAHIVTDGGKGSHIYLNNESIHIPAAAIYKHSDPTGCGDAYRAGLIFGILNNLNWALSGKLASIMGGISYESQGSQNHVIKEEEIYERYTQSFGESLELKKLLITSEK